MNLIALILVLGVIGLVLWLVVSYIPMPEPYKRVVVVVVVILVIIWLLRVLGVAVPNV